MRQKLIPITTQFILVFGPLDIKPKDDFMICLQFVVIVVISGVIHRIIGICGLLS